MGNGEYYCDCSICQLIERRSVRILVGGMEEGVRGIFFAVVLALVVTTFAGSPEQLYVTPKTHHRVEQLGELHRQLRTVTHQLENLSRQNSRLYTHLFQISSQMPDRPRDTSRYRRTFYLAGTSPPPIDSMLFAISAAVGQLQREVTRQQNIIDRRTEWSEQFPLVLPAAGAIASGFGMRHHPVHNEQRLHEGIDISLPGGSPVLATGAGMVTMADTVDGYGYHVRILHPATGHLTLYAHLSKVPAYIEVGQWINRGEVLGYSGDSGVTTGPHLHYEIRNAEGRPLNPIDFLLPSRRNHVSDQHHALARIDSLFRKTGV